MMEKNPRLKMMVNVAHLYYREKLTQTQIAEQLGISHATVSRIIADALEQGLVEIVIHYPQLRDRELENTLLSFSNLKDVRVMDSDGIDDDNLHEGLGMLAGEILDEYLHDGMSIGVSRGRGVNATARHLMPHKDWRIDFVQLQGAMEDQNDVENDLQAIFFEKFNASFHVLHAPLILDDEKTRELLVKKPLISNVLELARQVELALVGIGTLDFQYSNHFINGEFDEREILALQNEGLVGDICGLHFRADGSVPLTSINKRIVSIDEKSLKEIPLVIGVGGGQAKAVPIQAALQGNFLDVLVTDNAVASQLAKWNDIN